MAIVDIRELRALVPPGRRIMGLDPGSKTIGIAVSDVSGRLASPLETLRRGKFRADAERLARLAPDQRAEATAPSGPVLCVAPAGSHNVDQTRIEGVSSRVEVRPDGRRDLCPALSGGRHCEAR